MKRNNYKIYREIVLNMMGNKCMNCNGVKRLSIHHADNDFKNNQLDNILLLCCKCHGINHGVDHREKIKRGINEKKLKEVKQKIKSNTKKPSSSKLLKCKKCGKVIEGYNKNHVQFLMRQHMMKHENEEKKINTMEEKENARTNRTQ